MVYCTTEDIETQLSTATLVQLTNDSGLQDGIDYAVCFLEFAVGHHIQIDIDTLLLHAIDQVIHTVQRFRIVG